MDLRDTTVGFGLSDNTAHIYSMWCFKDTLQKNRDPRVCSYFGKKNIDVPPLILLLSLPLSEMFDYFLIFNIISILSLSMTAVFTYSFLLRVSGNRIFATMCALIFISSNYFVWELNLGHIDSLLFFPMLFCLLSIEIYLDKPDLKRTVLLALSLFTVMIIYIPNIYFFVILIVLYGLWKLKIGVKNLKIQQLLIAFILAFCLSFYFTYPVLEQILDGTIGKINGDRYISELNQILDPSTATGEVFLLLLVLISISIIIKDKKSLYLSFLPLLFALFYIDQPINRFFLNFLPFFNAIRAPYRAVFFSHISVLILISISFSNLVKYLKIDSKKQILIAAIFVCLFLLITGRLTQRIEGTDFTVMKFKEPLSFDSGITLYYPESVHKRDLEWVDTGRYTYLLAAVNEFRIFNDEIDAFQSQEYIELKEAILDPFYNEPNVELLDEICTYSIKNILCMNCSESFTSFMLENSNVELYSGKIGIGEVLFNKSITILEIQDLYVFGSFCQS
ncbi:MAG: hypothetical protein ACW991_05380 [Candidatus Hodarchaeales archaeon]